WPLPNPDYEDEETENPPGSRIRASSVTGQDGQILMGEEPSKMPYIILGVAAFFALALIVIALVMFLRHPLDSRIHAKGSCERDRRINPTAEDRREGRGREARHRHRRPRCELHALHHRRLPHRLRRQRTADRLDHRRRRGGRPARTRPHTSAPRGAGKRLGAARLRRDRRPRLLHRTARILCSRAAVEGRAGHRPAAAERAAMTKTVLFWRHGQTDFNVEGRFQGQSDVPLNDTGRSQAEDAARRLLAFEPGLIVSSDLARAAATADSRARLAGRGPVGDGRLREPACGEWEGSTRAEVAETWPRELADWAAGVDVAPPGGESRSQSGRRVASAITDIVESSSAETIVIVAHGAVLRGAAEILLELGGA